MIVYTQEKIPWGDMSVMLKEHYEEISSHHDIALKPDVDRYNLLEQNGSIVCFTARKESSLIGYAIYIVSINLHYSDSLQALQDVLFIRTSERKGGVGIGLIRYADKGLKKMGVQIVYQHVKVAHDFGPLLERLGYTFVERVFSKRLDLEG